MKRRLLLLAWPALALVAAKPTEPEVEHVDVAIPVLLPSQARDELAVDAAHLALIDAHLANLDDRLRLHDTLLHLRAA